MCRPPKAKFNLSAQDTICKGHALLLFNPHPLVLSAKFSSVHDLGKEMTSREAQDENHEVALQPISASMQN